MKRLAVIPARYASQRFPGKPLAMLGDRPVVQWVYEVVKASSLFDEVLVATDDERIAKCVHSFGGMFEMTKSYHQTGTDRVAEVTTRFPDMEIIINVQGDQPFVTSDMLSQLLKPYLQGEMPDVTTLACPLDKEVDYTDPNIVKVVCDQRMHALYFSRSSIPYYRNPCDVPVYHHLGLYAFRREFITHFAQLKVSPLEMCEGLEQLRILENGYSIQVCKTSFAPLEINTLEDLEKASALLYSKV